MKVGDLVRWTRPESQGLGVIMPKPGKGWDDHVFIAWLDKPQYNGPYPANHRYLELVSESR